MFEVGSLRVRMVIRENAHSVLGGDTVQMRQTAKALRSLGVAVDESCGLPTDDEVEASHIVHVFNLQTPDFTLAAVNQARRLGRPVALSSIFWDFGAEKLIHTSPKWGVIAKVVGRRLALALAQRRVEAASRDDRDKLKSILANADIWLPNSEAEARTLRHLSRADRPAHIIPNGVDSERLDPTRSRPFPPRLAERGLRSKDYLLIAGRLDPDKNQLGFLRAISDTKIPVVLCGPTPDAPYASACRELCDNVFDTVKGDELDAFLWHSRVHALPSFRETPGLANLEAAALGCVILSTTVGSTHEYFGEEAHYCAPWSPASMRHAAETAWNAKPSSTLSQKVRCEFSWQIAGIKTAAAYAKISAASERIEARTEPFFWSGHRT